MKDEYFEQTSSNIQAGDYVLLYGNRSYVVGRPAPNLLYTKFAWVVHDLVADLAFIVHEDLIEKL